MSASVWVVKSAASMTQQSGRGVIAGGMANATPAATVSGDGGGGRGFATPYSFNGGADGWREGCLQAGAVTATRRGPRAAGGRREAGTVTAPQPVAAQDAVIFNEPGRRARVAWGDGGDPMPRVHAERDTALGRLCR